jgi:hypothetical protein
MKHGDKAKSKAASKASSKKSSKVGARSKAPRAKSSKASHKASHAVQKHQAASSKTAKQTPAGKSHAAGDNGKARLRVSPDELTFSNPIVSAAFKRAVKKYANAFRKLTD